MIPNFVLETRRLTSPSVPRMIVPLAGSGAVQKLGGCLSSGRCLRMLRNVPTTLSPSTCFFWLVPLLFTCALLAGSFTVWLVCWVVSGLQNKWQVELEFGSYEQYDAQRHDALKRRRYAYRWHRL